MPLNKAVVSRSDATVATAVTRVRFTPQTLFFSVFSILFALPFFQFSLRVSIPLIIRVGLFSQPEQHGGSSHVYSAGSGHETCVAHRSLHAMHHSFCTACMSSWNWSISFNAHKWWSIRCLWGAWFSFAGEPAQQLQPHSAAYLYKYGAMHPIGVHQSSDRGGPC